MKRIHLTHHDKAACGVNTARLSTNPASVTCGSCRRTVAMADAEVRVQSLNRKERHDLVSS